MAKRKKFQKMLSKEVIFSFPLKSLNQKRKQDELYIQNAQNALVAGYDKIPDAITSVIYDRKLKLSAVEKIVYKKIYSRVQPPLKPLELRKVIAYGRMYNFEEIGPEKQEDLLIKTITEIQKHPYLKRLFLYDVPGRFKGCPIRILMGPEVDAYLKCEEAVGESWQGILLSKDMYPMTLLHETLHHYQEWIGVTDSQTSKDATTFIERIACEAQAEAIGNLCDETLSGLGAYVYEQNLNQFETKEEAERQTVGILMALYLSKESDRAQILQDHHIPAFPELQLLAQRDINTWQKFYAANVWEDLPHNHLDHHYDSKRIKALNDYYNTHYHMNKIAVENGLTLVELGDHVRFVQTGKMLQGKTYSHIVNGATQETIVHIALEEHDFSHVPEEMIIKCANLKNELGDTPLISALELVDAEAFVEPLLQYGADTNVSGNDGEYPLYVACACCDEAIMELLLKYKADPNSLNGMMNESALHLAVKENKQEAAAVLLRYQADPNIQDCHGLTPLDYATDDQMRFLLKKYGAKTKEERNAKQLLARGTRFYGYNDRKQNIRS